MRTECIEIFKFDELSDEAKKEAIEWYRGIMDHQYVWDEAHETVKAFHREVGTESGTHSWLDVRVGSFDCDILELKGMRLRTWILNNWEFLYRPKYIGCIDNNNIYTHKRIKSKGPFENGNVFNPYYSGCQVDNSCVLTGVCYDHSLLEPVYKFIEWDKDYSDMDLDDLLRDCFNNLRKDIESECEAREEDEYIQEEIEANEYEFAVDGSRY